MKVIASFLVLLLSQNIFAYTCVPKQAVRGWRSVSDNTLILEARSSEYKVVVDFCRELPWAHRIAFDTFFYDKICAKDRILILNNFGSSINEACYIRSIEKIED